MNHEALQKQRWYRSKGVPLIGVTQTLVASCGMVQVQRYECHFEEYSEVYIVPLVNDTLAFTHGDFVSHLTVGSYTEAELLSEDSTNPILKVNDSTVIKLSPFAGGLMREYEVYTALSVQKGIVPLKGAFHLGEELYGLLLSYGEGVSGWDFWDTLSGSKGEKALGTIIKNTAEQLANLHLILHHSFATHTQPVDTYIKQVNAILLSAGKEKIPFLGGEVETQVIHGDFHLGQLLVDATLQPIIIDFEGEPISDKKHHHSGTIDPRDHCMPREYDVACFLRSLDYAESLKKNTFSIPKLKRTFVDSYINTLNDYNVTVSKILIDHFTLIRCAYEVAYERKNRPFYAQIPQDHLRVLVTLYG
ncbi:MAG: phosphotransferase [Fibrobacterales bacterium]